MGTIAKRVAACGLALAAGACGSSYGGGGNGGGSAYDPPVVTPPVQTTAPTVALEAVFPQLPAFVAPVLALQAPGNATRWYVVEQRGMVHAFDNDPAVTAATVFADLRARVDATAGEAGLLGMAFHPNFATNGFVYLSYTRNLGTLESVIARYTVNGGVLDPASESILLTVPQPFSNHNGGNLAFGPDGYLYIGFGDGGSGGDPQGNGQNTQNLLGAMLRIDVDGAAPYAIPVDNPFANFTPCQTGSGTQSCPEIYAWGFRNPWRWSFDRQTGELWVGDVGQGDWEEVDRVDRGLNYGWNAREGAHCYPPGSTGCSTANVDPVTEYSHAAGDRSITGGYVYRGSAFTALRGYYVFADFISGRLWAVRSDSPLGTAPSPVLASTYNVASFAEGTDGELYLVSYAGRLYRVVPAP